MQIPEKIRIKRIEDYHTHFIGKCRDNRQFMIYETFVFSAPPRTVAREDWKKLRREYVVLYLFDNNEILQKTEHFFAGTTDNYDSATINTWIEVKLEELGNVNFTDIEVKPFQTNIDGYTFGLVPNEEYGVIEMQPSNTISFSFPWGGEYDT